MSTRVRRIVSVLLGGMLVLPVCADAGGGLTGGATLPEQIVQEATLIQSKISGAERLVEQIQQYENMVQNMVTLPQTLMNQVLQPVDQLYGLVSQAQALTTNAINISQQFQNLNAGFNPQITAEYSSQYESISQGLNNALNTLIQTAGLNPDDFANQAQAQQAIANAMANPNSRNALLQGAVAVGQQTTASLTQLYNLTRAEAQTEADWRKAQLDDQSSQVAANQAVQQAMYGNPQDTQPGVVASGGVQSTLSKVMGQY